MTAKEVKMKNLYKQWKSITDIIDRLDGESCFVIHSSLFPEVLEGLQKLGWDVTFSDEDLIPAYLFDCSNIELTEDELRTSFQESTLSRSESSI